MISDIQYLDWQKKITENKIFREWWIFWGVYSVVFVFIAGLVILYLGKIKVVEIALLSFILGRAIISPLIYQFHKKQRPYQKLNFIAPRPLLFPPPKKRFNSFPSDHALSFSAVTSVIIYFFPLIGLGLVVAAILNGIGRIILGYHFISDVLAGWILGMLCGMVIIFWIAPMLIK